MLTLLNLLDIPLRLDRWRGYVAARYAGKGTPPRTDYHRLGRVHHGETPEDASVSEITTGTSALQSATKMRTAMNSLMSGTIPKKKVNVASGPSDGYRRTETGC